jgi:hypothetical protein
MSFNPKMFDGYTIQPPAPATVGTPSSTIHLRKMVLRRKPLHKMKAYSDDFINDTGSYAPPEPPKKMVLRRKKLSQMKMYADF